LDVAQGDAGVEGGGDESVSQRVRADRLRDAGLLGDSADDSAGAVPVEALPSRRRKIGPSRRSPMARSRLRAVRGASGMAFNGGYGGVATSSISVNPGEVIHLEVGGMGLQRPPSDPAQCILTAPAKPLVHADGPQATASDQTGGWNGGGSGGQNGNCGSAGGGGASDVRTGGDDLGDRKLVAGGGGGGSGNLFFEQAGGGGFPNGGSANGDGGGSGQSHTSAISSSASAADSLKPSAYEARI
jgi:hypothetical protein